MFNIGRKDEYGKQRRIEHRGRHLRASRTGGVALRAQTRAAGVNLTGNTSRGVRVSATPAKNTQVAFQNGRFVLRGRYSAGPMRLNLSKSGLSLSARNRMGSFNLTNPGRSSAKIAGVQVRGKAAAQIQAVYGVFVGLGMLLKFTAQAAWFLLRLTITVIGGLWNALVAIPGVLGAIARAVRNFRLRRRVRRWARDRAPWPEHWDAEALQAALVLAYVAWGLGWPARALTELWANDPEAPTQPKAEDLQRWQEIADALDARLPEKGTEQDVRTVFAALSEKICARVPDGARAELIFQADDLAQAHGTRTRRQDALIEIYCDFAELRLDVDPEAHPDPEAQGEGANSTAATASPASLNLNAAPLDDLIALPNIGEARAREIVARRPFNSLDELEAIHGIGAGTVEQLRELGVRVER